MTIYRTVKSEWKQCLLAVSLYSCSENKNTSLSYEVTILSYPFSATGSSYWSDSWKEKSSLACKVWGKGIESILWPAELFKVKFRYSGELSGKQTFWRSIQKFSVVFFSFPIEVISDGIVDSLNHNENIEMTWDFTETEISIYLYRAMPVSSS